MYTCVISTLKNTSWDDALAAVIRPILSICQNQSNLPGSLQVEVRPRYLRSLRNSEASREGSAVTEPPMELGSWKVVVASKLLGEVELLSSRNVLEMYLCICMEISAIYVHYTYPVYTYIQLYTVIVDHS